MGQHELLVVGFVGVLGSLVPGGLERGEVLVEVDRRAELASLRCSSVASAASVRRVAWSSRYERDDGQSGVLTQATDASAMASSMMGCSSHTGMGARRSTRSSKDSRFSQRGGCGGGPGLCPSMAVAGTCSRAPSAFQKSAKAHSAVRRRARNRPRTRRILPDPKVDQRNASERH